MYLVQCSFLGGVMRNSKQLSLALALASRKRFSDDGHALKQFVSELNLDRSKIHCFSDIINEVNSVIRHLRFKERGIVIGSKVMIHGSSKVYEVVNFTLAGRALLKGKRGAHNPESLILIRNNFGGRE
jgi:hypothetical protein